VNLRPVLAALLGHWRRHRVQLATLIIGLAAATALWSGVQALNAQARASYDRAASVLGGTTLAAVIAQDGQRFDLADHVALRRAGWPVSPMLEGDFRAGGTILRLIGIDPVSLPPEAGALNLGADTDRTLDFIAPPWLALAEPGTAARLAGSEGLPGIATAEDLPPDTLLVDIGLAERLLGAEGRVTRLLIAPGWDAPLPDPLATRLRVAQPEDTGDLARLTDSFHLNLTAFGFLSFVVGLFIVYSAIGLAFEQRKPLFRTLRACGVSARTLTLVLLAELTGLALIAGALGVAAGYLLAATLLPDVAASLRGLYGARVPGTLALEPWWWAAGLGMSLAGALAAAATALWRAAILPLLAPAQPAAWAAAQARALRLQSALGAALWLGALAALLWGQGIAGGFAVMGGLLLGAALILPGLLALILRAGGARARAPLVQWAWADGRQQLGGLSLALMALLLALAVNVGVGTMVDSFRRTFLGYLDQRLASELYVAGRDADQAAAMAGWLADRDDVAAVLPIWNAATRFRAWPTEVYGFADHPTYRDNWPVIATSPDAWDAVARGEAALVSEQLARRFALTPGDRVEIATPAGPWPVTVAAIYADYGNPEGQIMVAVEELTARFPEADRLRFAVRTDDSATLLADLRAAFPLDETQAVDQAALKDISRRIFERTFAVTVALNALTLAVAGIALLTALLTLSTLRLGQLAPLWAMGITRARLARIEMGRTLGLALLTALVAIPLGLAVAWVLTKVVNVRAFGWELPVFLFPGQWAGLVALALLTAFLAALHPVWRLRRAEPADLLRSFSNER
jgi:putative ABC transport system permease protein